MSDDRLSLDITPDQVALIEAALQTQKKILSVQAGAGASAARARLSEVKRLLASIAQQKPGARTCATRKSTTWLGMSRIFG